MGVATQSGPDQWDKGRTNPDSFTLITKSWIYTRPEDVASDTVKLSKYLEREIPLLHWRTKAVSETENIKAIPGRDGLAYVPLIVYFTTTAGGREKLSQRNTCLKHYDTVSRALQVALYDQHMDYDKAMGPNKRIASYTIATDWGYAKMFSTYQNTETPGLPAQTIGAAMSRLTDNSIIGGWNADKTHKDCGPEAVLECLQSLMNQHAKLWDVFCNQKQRVFELCNHTIEGNLAEVAQQTLNTAVQVNKVLQAATTLLEKNVGRDTTIDNRFIIVRAWKKLIGDTFNTIRLDEPAVEKLKEDIRREFNHFRRISLSLTGHLRLCKSSERKLLKDAVDSARDGTEEKTRMPRNLGLNANRIGDMSMHAKALTKCLNNYTAGHDESMAHFDVMINTLDRAYATQGNKLFSSRKVRRARQPLGYNCLVEKAKLDEKTMKVEGEWSDSDSTLD